MRMLTRGQAAGHEGGRRLVLSPFFRFDSAMDDQPPGDRAVILACSVRSLRRWQLATQCASGRSVVMPLQLMVASGLGGLTIASVLVQLRCKNCGKRPPKARLLQDSSAGTPRLGYDNKLATTGWVVPLVGDDGTPAN